MTQMSDIMAEARSVRAAIAEHNAALKDLKAKKDKLDGKMIAMLDESGTDMTRDAESTAFITEAIMPNVDDFDTLLDFIKENDAWFLLTRSVSAPAYRDLLEEMDEVPGLVPFTKRTLNFRKR